VNPVAGEKRNTIVHPLGLRTMSCGMRGLPMNSQSHVPLSMKIDAMS
jgi:hypothetical protein